MDKYISATADQRKKLEKIFNCTDRTIRNALSFRETSERCERIRVAATKMGCQTYIVTKESECFYDSNGDLVQPFQNGAVIELSKTTGIGRIVHNGHIVATYTDVNLTDIPAIQQRAASL